MIGRKRLKKEIPVPLSLGDRMNKSTGSCVMFDRSPKSAPPVYGNSLDRKARDGSKFECLSPYSDSRHSLGNNFFFSRPNSPHDQYFSQSVSNSDSFAYALKQIKNSELVGRLDVGSGENRSFLKRQHSNTPRKFYSFGTPPRDGHKPFEMIVPRSPDQPHSFAGYSKLLYSGYPKILAARRLQDMNVLVTNDHLENLFTTPSKRNEPSTGKSSTHKEQTIGSGSTLSSRTVKDDTLGNANKEIMNFFKKKETKSASKTSKLSGIHQGQLRSSKHKKNELGNSEKRLQMILALDRATSLVKRENTMTMLSPPTLIDNDQEKEDIIGSDKLTERSFSKSEFKMTTLRSAIVLPKENQDISTLAKPSNVVDNDISSASASQTSPAKEDDLIEAEKRMQAFLMAKSAQTTPMTSRNAFNRFTFDKSTKADEVPHITSEYIETLKTVSNKSPVPSVMDQLPENTIDEGEKREIEDSVLCSPVKDNEFADAHRRMMEFLKTKGNKKTVKTFQTSSTGNEVKSVNAPTSQEHAVVQSEKNSEQAQLDQAKDSELEEAAKRMQKLLASKQSVSAVTVSINVASSTQSQTSKTEIGLPETPDSETRDSLTAAGTSLCENNTIMMNNKVTSETSRAIGDASLKAGSSASAEISLCGNNRKTAIIQGTFQTSPAKTDAILEAEKRMQTFLAAKQAKSADKKFPEPATGDMVRNTETSISQQTDRFSECNSNQLTVNHGANLDDVDNPAKQEPCKVTNVTSDAFTALGLQGSDPNQPKLNQAEDSELEEAAKRMQTFLASKKTTSVVKQNINVTNHIPTKLVYTEPASGDNVITGIEKLESTTAQPPTAKTEIQFAKITDNKTHCSLASAGTTLGGSDRKTAIIKGTSQTSPAKEDAILEAEKRMQAFLASKQVKPAVMKRPEPTKLEVNSLPSGKVEKSAKLLDTGMTIKTELSFAEEFPHITSEDIETLKTVSNKLPMPSVMDQLPENTTVMNKTEIENSVLCSPVKDDEFADAHKRMMEFLKTKGNKNGGKTFQTCSTGNEVKTVDAPTSQEPGTDRKTAIIKGTSQTSPAKDDAILEAEKRMQEFLAAKQTKLTTMKFPEPTTRDLVRNTKTSISQQTERFPECNPKQPQVKQGAHLDHVDSAAKQEPCKTTNVTSAPLTAVSLQGINTNQQKLTQAEDSELEEAAKRMQTFLASKLPISAVTRNIIVVAPAQSQTCSVATEIQFDEVKKSAKLLDTEVTTTPAEITEIEEANKKMLEYLARRETAEKVTPVAVVTGIMPKSCATPTAMMPIAPTLPNPVPLLEAVKNPTISTPEKLKTNVAEESDQMTPIGKGESEREARVSTPTRFISSPELSIPSTPIQSPEKPVAAEIEVKPVVVVQPPPPPIVMPGDPMWLAQQMAMLFGHPMLIQPCIEEKPKVVETIVPRLSLPVNCEAVSNALTEMEITKRLNETQSHSSCQLTIHHSTPKKSCLRKPDLFDNVPDYISHAKTPCQTPMKLQFEKKTRPPKPIYNRRERLRRQPINLVFPGRAKKSVKFQCDANLISEEPTYDEVVNGGGSGFKILSIVDYNTNTVCYPKYIPPSDFCRK